MPGLDQYFNNGSIIGQQLGLQAFNQAQDNQALQGADTLQKLFQSEQMNPLKLQEQTLQNQTAQAQLPGHQATSAMSQRKNALEEEFLPQIRDTKASEYKTALSEDEIKQGRAFAQRLLWHKDPAMQKIGQEMLDNDFDFLKEKNKQKYMSDRQNELARINGGYHLEQARILNEGRVAAKTAGGTDKPMNMSQLEAWARRRIAEDPTDMVAAGILVGKQKDAVERATSGVAAKDELTRELIKRPDATPPEPASPSRYSAQPGASAPTPAPAPASIVNDKGERFILSPDGKSWIKAQ